MTPHPEARRATPAELAQLRLDRPGAAAHCTTPPRRFLTVLTKPLARPLRALGALFAAMALVAGVTVALPADAHAAGTHPTITLSKASTRDCGNVGVKTPGVPYVQVERSLNPKSTTTGYWTKDLPSLGYIKVGKGCTARVESITGRYTIKGTGAWAYSGKPTRGTVTITIT